MDKHRKTGRTTRLLLETKAVGGIFVVRNDAARRSIKTLPESEGVEIKTVDEMKNGILGRRIKVIYDHY